MGNQATQAAPVPAFEHQQRQTLMLDGIYSYVERTVDAVVANAPTHITLTKAARATRIRYIYNQVINRPHSLSDLDALDVFVRRQADTFFIRGIAAPAPVTTADLKLQNRVYDTVLRIVEHEKKRERLQCMPRVKALNIVTDVVKAMKPAPGKDWVWIDERIRVNIRLTIEVYRVSLNHAHVLRTLAARGVTLDTDMDPTTINMDE